jgi:hypothetical protein
MGRSVPLRDGGGDGDVLLLLRDAGRGEVMERDALSFLGDSLFLLRKGEGDPY